jgi:hypothetical protein
LATCQGVATAGAETDLAKPFQQLTVVPEVYPQHLRHAEDVLPVWERVRYRFIDKLAKEQYLFLMARWTEPAPLTGEGQEGVLVTLGTMETGITVTMAKEQLSAKDPI